MAPNLLSRFTPLLLLPFVSSVEATPTPPFVKVAPTTSAITIDGVVDPEEWKEAFSATGVTSYKHGGVDTMGVRYWFTYDENHIYVAAQMETPEGANLNVLPRRLAKSENVTRFEVLLDPKSNHPDTSWVQGMFTPMGQYRNLGYNQRIGGFVPYKVEWNYKDSWKDNHWTIELSAPVTAFDRASLHSGEVWGILVAGLADAGPGYFSGQMGEAFSTRAAFLKAILTSEAPQLSINGFNKITGETVTPEIVIQNRGKKEASYCVRFAYRTGKANEFSRSFDPSTAPLETHEQALSAKPGEKASASWTVTLPKEKTTDGWLTIEVTSADGAETWYAGTYKLGVPRLPKWREATRKAEIPDVLLAIHPYPSFNQLNLVVDYAGLQEAPSKIRFSLKDAEGKTLKETETVIDTAKKDLDHLLKLPETLAEGDYTITAEVLDAQGKKLKELSESYRHQHFEFLNNRLGVSDSVRFPWTPIVVEPKAHRLDVWNRSYQFAPSGFPEQITTQGKEILAGPIRLVAKRDGKSSEIKGVGMKFTRTGQATVEGEASANGDGVNTSVRLLAEYDGMLKYEVTISGKKGEKLEALDLILPLKEEFAEFLHATGDGCRSNYAHALPKGNGTVWDSREIVNWVMPGQWLAYLWLGDTERGLCWWADSAEGWTLPKKPNAPVVRVERVDGEVRAVFQLVTPGSTVLWRDETPRKIVFALEATPVRPKPSWVRDIGLNDPKITHQKGPLLTWIGSAHWATWGQKETPYTFAYLRPINADAEEHLRKRAEASAKEGRDLLLYTDMRSRALVGDWEKAFAWEWNPNASEEPSTEFIRNAQHYQGIQVNTAPSRIDYDLWCYNHLMDLGARAFYFDEIQAEGQINPTAGLGYQDEDGKWMPTLRLFAYRDLWKRLYTLMQERGIKEPVIILHNTSTTYAGPMAFATATWDFEEANSDPNQRQLTKFGIDYLITESMGHQYGFAASTLGPSPGFERWLKPGDTAAETHAARHWTGVHMILDMNPYLRLHPTLAEGLGILGEFGWNKPGTEWIPYWKGTKEDFFTLTPGADKRYYSALYRRGNEGLLILLNDTNENALLSWKPGANLRVKGPLREVNPGNSQIKRNNDGSYPLEVPRYDYRAFRVTLE